MILCPLDCVCDSSVSKPDNLTSSAFIIKRDKDKVVYSAVEVFNGVCNNIGELRAIYSAMKWIREYVIEGSRESRESSSKESSRQKISSQFHILIRTDSEEALGMIHYPKQVESIRAREIFLCLRSKVHSLSLIRVQRSEVNLAHVLAREGLRRERERLERKKIESHWKAGV